jgi:hypothetical protein
MSFNQLLPDIKNLSFVSAKHVTESVCPVNFRSILNKLVFKSLTQTIIELSEEPETNFSYSVLVKRKQFTGPLCPTNV